MRILHYGTARKYCFQYQILPLPGSPPTPKTNSQPVYIDNNNSRSILGHLPTHSGGESFHPTRQHGISLKQKYFSWVPETWSQAYRLVRQTIREPGFLWLGNTQGRKIFRFWSCPDHRPFCTCLLWFVDGFVCLDKDQTLFIFNQHCGPLLEFLRWSFHLDSEEHYLLIGWRSWDLKYRRDPENPFICQVSSSSPCPTSPWESCPFYLISLSHSHQGNSAWTGIHRQNDFCHLQMGKQNTGWRKLHQWERS